MTDTFQEEGKRMGERHQAEAWALMCAGHPPARETAFHRVLAVAQNVAAANDPADALDVVRGLAVVIGNIAAATGNPGATMAVMLGAFQAAHDAERDAIGGTRH